MIPKILAVGLIAAFVGALLSEMGCKAKKVFVVLSAVMLLLGICKEVFSVLSEILSLGEDTGVGEATKSALKIVGIGYVYGISSDICEELGEPGIAGVLGLSSRVETFLVALPFLKKIVEMGLGLIQ